MKHLLTTALFLITPVMFWAGCSQTIYNRETLTVDPNGTATYERIHLGSTGVATAKTIRDLAIRTARGTIGLNQATADNDSLKVKVSPVTKTVEIETVE